MSGQEVSVEGVADALGGNAEVAVEVLNESRADNEFTAGAAHDARLTAAAASNVAV